MSKNTRGAIAGVVGLAASVGYVIYGFTAPWGVMPATAGLVAGCALVGIEWIRRQPGRTPNPKAMFAARVVGVGLYPLLVVAGASDRFTDRLGVFGAGLVAPLLALIVIATPIIAGQQPGYWSR
ncbi:MAG: hypothetical protein JWM72_1544 [Actinomycetia bacterium]|nr:hypothetical protein [Actinomycetes bacterium]